MPYQFSHLVFIGKFQLPHEAHLDIIKKALSLSERVILMVGSSNMARSPYLPFTFEERDVMIELAIKAEFPNEPNIMERISIRPVLDLPNNNGEDPWISHVKDQAIQAARSWTDTYYNFGLIGHSKDQTSFYLKMFPDWKGVDVGRVFNEFGNPVSSTDLRRLYFNGAYNAVAIANSPLVPKGIRNFLEKFSKSEAYDWIRREADFYTSYKESWKAAPYPPGILCADNVIPHAGKILLVQRKKDCGVGLWALPGGHVNPNETFKEASIRELKEETKIKDSKGSIPAGRLGSYITDSLFIDTPNRSLRGRVVTEAFRYQLPDKDVYTVRAGDDAKAAKWCDINKLDPRTMFEDHAFIIDRMLGTSICRQVTF